MKICIQTIGEDGTKKSSKLFLTNCTTTNKLLTSISKEIGVHKSNIIVKLKNQPFNIRIIDEWPLDIYPLRHGSILIVQYNQKWYGQKWQSIDTLDRVQEQNLEDVEDEQIIKFMKNNRIESQNFQKYLQENLDNFLSLVRKQELQKIALALKEVPEIIDDKERQSQLIQFKHQYLLNQIGECGRNALHWAIHVNNIEIVSFLLIKGANPNVLTIDETSPLQLAVKLRTYPIMSMLLQHPKIDINQVTNLGTALHLSIFNQDLKSIELLLQYNVDINTQNNEKQTALSLCSNNNIKRMIQKKQNLKRIKIPNITKGNIKKIVLFTNQQRILLINPFKNQFIFEQDVQHDEEQKYLLSQINQIRPKIQKMQFSVVMSDKKEIIFAVKNDNIYKKWLKAFNYSLKYQEYIHYNKKIPNSEQLIQILDDRQNKISLHKRILSKKDPNEMKKTSIIDMARRQSQIPQILISKIKNNQFNTPPPAVKEDNHHHEDINYRISTISQCRKESDIDESFLSSGKIVLGSVIEDVQDSSNSSFFFDNVNRSYYRSVYEDEQIPSNTSFLKLQNTKIHDFCLTTSLTQSITSKKQSQVSFKDFKMIKVLGNGTYGQVYLAKYAKDGKLYALKVLNKKRLNKKKSLKYAVGEVNVMKKIKSPFIINMYHAFQTPNNLYISLDYCPNGDLSELIAEKGQVEQKTAMLIIAQIVLAIEELHQKNILYRDLKPQNILIASDGYIKLTDFGLSRQSTFSMTFCGSPAYLSPEMLNKKGVGLQSDIYGIGCLLYQMVVGQPPYYDEDLEVLYENIRSGKLMFPSSLSISIKSLISKLLQRDVNKRIGKNDFSEIKRHDFFKKFDWKLLLSKKLKVPKQMFLQADSQNEHEIKLQSNEYIMLDDKDYDQHADKMSRVNYFDYCWENGENY